MEKLLGEGAIDIKSVKYYISKKLIFILLILILVFTIILSINVCSKSKEKSASYNVEEYRNKIIETFKNNKIVFKTLVTKLHSKNDEIDISYIDKKIIYLVNGKKERLDEEDYILFKKIFILLESERISLYKSSVGGKVLEIDLPSEGPYFNSMIFSKNRINKDYMYEFSPGWYYKFLGYT